MPTLRLEQPQDADEMVQQQQFNGVVAAVGQQQQQQQNSLLPLANITTELNGTAPQQYQTQQQQYSPQANFYQQQQHQLMKQQFVPQQQQVSRYINGNSTHQQFVQQQQQQQNSPSSMIGSGQQQQQQPQQQQQVNGIYNNNNTNGTPQQHQSTLSRQSAPLYASRAANYYGQTVAAAAQQPQLYQATRQQVSYQHFPQDPNSASNQIRHHQVSQQQQLQHLVTPVAAYRQQPLTELMAAPHQQVSPAPAASLVAASYQLPVVAQMQHQHQQAGWSQPMGNCNPNLMHQHQQQQQSIHVNHHSNRLMLQSSKQQPSMRFHSDRDSVSTLSRFNDTRSFTMRSQFTNAYYQNALINGRSRATQFGFLRLTQEALKRVLGLAGPSVDVVESSGSSSSSNNNNNNKQPLLSMQSEANNSKHQFGSTKITSIDSGEDYYFKRQVFKYQLAILRLVNVLLSCFVLLSPVLMLLLPKMEFILNASSSSSHVRAAPLEQQQQPKLVGGGGIVTHAVGLGPNVNIGQSQQQARQWRISECNSTDCDGPLIGFVIRFIILTLAHWAIFFRPQTVTLPRLELHRCLLVSLATLITFTYWLFFIFRLFDKRFNDFELQYLSVVEFGVSMLETLILLHYLALLLLELRKRKKVYCIKVVRSPDGQSYYYNCGLLSIQKCGQFVLEKYYKDFSQLSAHSRQLLEYEDQMGQRQLEKQRQRDEEPPSEWSARGRRSARHRREMTDDEDELQRAHQQQQQQQLLLASDNGNEPTDEHETQLDSNQLIRSTAERRRRGERARASSSRDQRRHSRERRSKSSRRRRRRDNENNEDNEHEDDDLRKEKSEQDNERESDSDSDSSERPAEDSSEREETKDGGSQQPQQQQQQQSTNESSLETVRLAGAKEEQQQVDVVENKRSSRRQRDLELESTRSGRSRRSGHSTRHRRQRDRSAGDSAAQSRSHSRRRSRSRDNVAAAAAAAAAAAPLSQPAESVAVELGDGAAEQHERKLRRRKLRLLASVQNVFGQIERVQQQQQQDEGSSETNCKQTGRLDASQMARSLYPNIARLLQKYLRLTRQTSRHNLQSIHEHLSKCILYRLSARVFLEKFFNSDPVYQEHETNLFADCRLDSGGGGGGSAAARKHQLELNSWSLICDTLLSRQIAPGTFFVLKQGQVSLLVSVAKIPHLNLSEQLVDQKLNRFTLLSSPETSSV